MLKVLIVEDFKEYIEVWRRKLGEKVEILSALTIEEAEEVFASNPDISLIVMDACVPGNEPNTMSLVKKIRQTFRGPIIATSNLGGSYTRKLMKAGCSDEVGKHLVTEKVIEVLDL